MKKEITLCGPCAAKMADGYKLTQLPKPINNKITCGLCGRRRYGGTYQVGKKTEAKKASVHIPATEK